MDVNVDVDVDRVNNTGTSIIHGDIDDAMDNSVHTQQTQTKHTWYKQLTSYKRRRWSR